MDHGSGKAPDNRRANLPHRRTHAASRLKSGGTEDQAVATGFKEERLWTRKPVRRASLPHRRTHAASRLKSGGTEDQAVATGLKEERLWARQARPQSKPAASPDSRRFASEVRRYFQCCSSHVRIPTGFAIFLCTGLPQNIAFRPSAGEAILHLVWCSDVSLELAKENVFGGNELSGKYRGRSATPVSRRFASEVRRYFQSRLTRKYETVRAEVLHEEHSAQSIKCSLIRLAFHPSTLFVG